MLMIIHFQPVLFISVLHCTLLAGYLLESQTSRSTAESFSSDSNEFLHLLSSHAPRFPSHKICNPVPLCGLSSITMRPDCLFPCVQHPREHLHSYRMNSPQVCAEILLSCSQRFPYYPPLIKSQVFHTFLILVLD